MTSTHAGAQLSCPITLASEQPAHILYTVGALLIGLGVLLVLLALGLAFTICGEISFVLGVACLGAAIVRIIRGPARPS